MKKIGIIGTGMIGTSFAVLSTGHNMQTVMLSMNDDLSKDSKAKFDAFYQQLTEFGTFTAETAAEKAKLLSYTLDYADLADCDMIFEAVLENLEIKHAVYEQLEKHCTKLQAICSVSSALPVNQLNANMQKYQDLLLVAHPFFPPHIIPYFELSTGKATSEQALTFAKNTLEELERKCVVLQKDVPGFIGNRLQFALWREAVNLVESGVCTPEDVDTCLMYSFCPRYTAIGIFEHFDNGGLQLNSGVCNTIFPTLSNADKTPTIISDLLAAGKSGRAAGQGFYDWSKKDMDDFAARTMQPYLQFLNWKIKE